MLVTIAMNVAAFLFLGVVALVVGFILLLAAIRIIQMSAVVVLMPIAATADLIRWARLRWRRS